MPHAYHFDANAMAEALTATINTFGFKSTNEGRALGELIVDEIIDGIQTRSIERQCDGNGVPWPKNAPSTAARKYAQYGEAIVNKDTGQMLSAKSLRGTTVISQYLITMDYGTNTGMAGPDRLPAVQRIGHRVDITGGQAKEVVTDVDKAMYAAEQGRGFYELDDQICDATFARFSETLGAHLANPGR
jgi:hypothetical protein